VVLIEEVCSSRGHNDQARERCFRHGADQADGRRHKLMMDKAEMSEYMARRAQLIGYIPAQAKTAMWQQHHPETDPEPS
jgi:hypothetical protein